MTPFPNGTGPAPHAPHAAAGTAGTSAIGGAHGRPCLSGAAFRRFTLPALLGLLLLAAPLHAAYGTESGTPPSGDMEWKGEASTPSRRCPILPFDGELTLGAGGNVSSSPYKGYGPDWLPFPMITYEGGTFFHPGVYGGRQDHQPALLGAFRLRRIRQHLFRGFRILQPAAAQA